MKIMTDAQFRRIIAEERNRAIEEAMERRDMREYYDRRLQEIWDAIYEIRRKVFPVNQDETTTKEIIR